MKALLPIPLSFGNGEGPDVVEGMSFGPEIIKMYISIHIYSILFRIYYTFFNVSSYMTRLKAKEKMRSNFCLFHPIPLLLKVH